jgi:hypothetical protein
VPTSAADGPSAQRRVGAILSAAWRTNAESARTIEALLAKHLREHLGDARRTFTLGSQVTSTRMGSPSHLEPEASAASSDG